MIFILIFILALCGSFIQRVSGFGFGVFVMMFFPFLLPTFGEAVTLSGLLAGTMSLMVVLQNWKSIRWQTMLWILIPAVLTSAMAIHFMSGLSNESMKAALGIVLILIAIFSLFFQDKIRIPKQSRPLELATGIASGITGGMFGMPGPPVVIYCIEAIPDKLAYVATLQAIFFSSNVFYTLFRAKAGFFTSSTLVYWAIGLTGVILGTWAGARCFNRISGKLLKQIVYIFMIISGIVAIV